MVGPVSGPPPRTPVEVSPLLLSRDCESEPRAVAHFTYSSAAGLGQDSAGLIIRRTKVRILPGPSVASLIRAWEAGLPVKRGQARSWTYRLVSTDVAVCLVLMLGLASCGGDEEAGSAISASEGGTVTSADGALTVEFPPGALPEDTEISIETVSDTDAATGGSPSLGNAYEVLPDDLVLERPARITMALALAETRDRVPLADVVMTNADGETQVAGAQRLAVDLAEGALRVTAETRHFSTVNLAQWAFARFEPDRTTQVVGDRFQASITFEILAEGGRPTGEGSVDEESSYTDALMVLDATPSSTEPPIENLVPVGYSPFLVWSQAATKVAARTRTVSCLTTKTTAVPCDALLLGVRAKREQFRRELAKAGLGAIPELEVTHVLETPFECVATGSGDFRIRFAAFGISYSRNLNDYVGGPLRRVTMSGEADCVVQGGESGSGSGGGPSEGTPSPPVEPGTEGTPLLPAEPGGEDIPSQPPQPGEEVPAPQTDPSPEETDPKETPPPTTESGDSTTKENPPGQEPPPEAE